MPQEIMNQMNNIKYGWKDKYEKPKYGINCLQFYKHCEHGEHIII